MKRAVITLFIAASIIGCAQKALETGGQVTIWTTRPVEELKRIASGLAGLAASEAPKDRPWLRQSADNAGSIDVVFTEWDRDLVKGFSDGIVADITRYWPRMKSTRRLWPGFKRPIEEKGRYFLPAVLYTWGLFYNQSILDAHQISYPGSLDDLEKTMAKLKGLGIAPLAVGASSGWSALAWFSYLDLRLNGLAAHQKLLAATRHFDDASLEKVYGTLQKWRDNGWFEPDSGSKSWSESLAEVENGRAAFMLMGAFAADRFTSPDNIRWAPVPQGSASGGTGELVVAQGFALSANARAPEAALALADAYVAAGSPDLTADAYSVAAVTADDKGNKPQKPVPYALSSIKATQAALLRSSNGLVPQMDRYLPPEAAYALNRAIALFFAPAARMTAEDLKAALKEIRY